VFHRIRWSSSHEMQLEQRTLAPKLQWRRKEHPRLIQNSNSKDADKGKRPMPQEVSPTPPICLTCAREGLDQPICRSGSFCSRCKKSGHLTFHCLAQWKSIMSKVNMGLNAKYLGFPNGASTSRTPLPPSLLLTDNLPDSLFPRDPSAT
jgi:hypothetical protein